MIARSQFLAERDPINHDSTKLTKSPRLPLYDPSRPGKKYFAYKFDEDAFRDPNLMDVDDTSEDEAERKKIKKTMQRAIGNYIEQCFFKWLHDIV